MGLLAALCAMPLNSARANFSNVLCHDYYGDASVSGNTQITGTTFNNNAYLSVSYSNLSNPSGAHNGAAAVLEYQPNVGYGAGPVTVSNGSGGTMRAVNTTPGGWAAGFWSDQIYGNSSIAELTLDNYGTAYGEGDATGFGLYNYNLYGGAKIANHSGATATGKGSTFGAGINSLCYYGAINFVNDGTATSTALGSGSSETTSYGINLFTYDTQASAAAPLYCVNNGTVQASIAGNGTKKHCYGMFVWAQGGKMTLINNGPVTGSGSGNTEGVYCGCNYGDAYVENNSQMVGSGAPGYGLGMEVDSGNTMTLVNRGLLKNDATSGQGQDGIWGGMGLVLWVNAGPANINNTGTIYGGNMGIWAGVYDGPITINNYGDIYGGGGEAFHLGNGNDTVYMNGLPTITGTMNGGNGNNSLIFNLTGTLQYVNGNPANSGNNLSAYNLGTSGYIVVSGKTYSWANFSVSGTATPGIANGTYKIINRNSGLALEAPNDWTGNGQQLNQWSYYGGASQQWTVTGLGNNLYKIIGVQSGRCVDVNNWGTSNGTKVQLWDYSGGSNQQFYFNPASGGSYEISPSHATGSCLDVNGVSTSNGANVQLWQWHTGLNQQWYLQSP